MDSCEEWAREVFGGAELGDVRRTRRLVWMAAEAVRSPSGKISEVFQNPAERQGAYDFIESRHSDAKAISEAVIASTARRCAEYPWVYVPMDGTSIKLWDGTGGTKGFGAIGTRRNGAVGLKIDNALAVSPEGVPIGVLGQVFWSRQPHHEKKRRPSYAVPVAKKETRFVLECIDQVTKALAEYAPGTRAWLQMDRGFDAQYVLLHLAASGHSFTVRSQSLRRMLTVGNRKIWLKDEMKRQPSIGQFLLELPETESRAPRRATMIVKAKHVVLRLRDKWARKKFELPINVVLVQEQSNRADRVDWLLLTNQPIASYDDCMAVVKAYAQRWRIEEYHKALKTGACNIEETRLHRSDRVTRWATILSAVAARTERLKYLARSSPDLPASVELAEPELEALFLLKQRRKTDNEVLSASPTIAEATRWIAELGGYTGKSSGGPPGTITIARGLERLAMATEMLVSIRKMR
jgi:hypothetical protein